MKWSQFLMSTAAALLWAGIVSIPAHAQVIVGGDGGSSVTVNWGVLDRLGPPPNLAGMLRGSTPLAAAQPQGRSGDVVFKPYAGEKKGKSKVAKTHPATSKAGSSHGHVAAAPAPVKKAAHKAPARPEVAELPPAEPKPEKTVKAVAVEPAQPQKPQVSLPQVPKAAVNEDGVAGEEVKVTRAEPAAAPAAAPASAPAPTPTPAQAVAAAPVAPAPALSAVIPVAATTQVAPAPAAPPVAAKPASTAPSGKVVIRKGDDLSILFAVEESRLPDAARADLVALAKKMLKDDGLGLQVLAFADGDDANASKARRLSLSRALEIRRLLMDEGVRSTRIDVRALGNKMEGNGPADRVDLVLTTR